MSEWSVREPGKLTFDEPPRELHVRIVNGTVNVVGTDEDSARLEVSELEGPELLVTMKGGALTVAYEDLPWKGFLKWLDRKGWRRSAVVSLAVPARTRVELGVVGATAVVSGLDERVEVKGVNGDTTLVGLTGPVRADTVAGSVEAQALSGDLRFNSVSGDLTVVEAGSSVRADSVSGSMIVDLDATGRPTDVTLTSVSGEIAIRLPHPADAEVEANTAGGTVSNAFEDLRVGGQWGAKRITGRLGAGNGKLKATTVSGSIALLRRPPAEDEPWDATPRDSGPEGSAPWDRSPKHDGTKHDGPQAGGPTDDGPTDDGPTDSPADPAGADSGENSVSGRDGGATGAPADGTTDKKVL
ncbi:DUF4097 family beta strand repeat-containing protein [Streptomyces sp. NPDC000987]|uniref:DUF4097 family beta strand repeat-containing protein n=1 Tax=Streptomyces sp. NPDC000987 TaxID=3154374 RepID=UPI00332FFEC1